MPDVVVRPEVAADAVVISAHGYAGNMARGP